MNDMTNLEPWQRPEMHWRGNVLLAALATAGPGCGSGLRKCVPRRR